MILTGVEKKLGNFTLCIEKLSIGEPGIYGLVGPNGSGKSTLAKLLAGLMEPDRGSIDSGGLESRDITFLDRKPYMMDDTVYNNLVYPLKLRKIKADPARVTLFMDTMAFSGREKQKAASLSGGEQQKLAFLRAIIFSPRFIIADEAMAALDMDSLDLVERTILEEQRKDPRIWIIISHQMPHIRRLCDYVFFMYQGKIEAGAATGEFFSGAANRHLARYLRSYGGGIPETGIPETTGNEIPKSRGRP